jgi:hypothetical protein
VACLGEVAPDSVEQAQGRDPWRPGLRLFPKTYFWPHWDALDTYVPGLTETIVTSVPADSRLLAIDERTAMVGDGADWSVMGSGRAHLMANGDWLDFEAGGSFSASLVR